jgi:hypothetical protein
LIVTTNTAPGGQFVLHAKALPYFVANSPRTVLDETQVLAGRKIKCSMSTT